MPRLRHDFRTSEVSPRVTRLGSPLIFFAKFDIILATQNLAQPDSIISEFKERRSLPES